MQERWNALQWDGKPGHYEVYYVTFTDPGTELGFWIRYTMVAPLAGNRDEATCSLWFMAMDRRNPDRNVGEKVSLPIADLTATADPFRLAIGDAWLGDEGMAGAIERDGARFAWNLHWQPRLPAYSHVHAALRTARIAKTTLFLPHPDLEVEGSIDLEGRRVELAAARGAQAHLWGSKHAARWAWAHCNDFMDAGGNAQRDSFLDGVSVFVPRFGREVGPNTPIVARVKGRDFLSTNPWVVTRNASTFDLTSWRFEARARGHKLIGTVSTRKDDLVGVTYHDPDGELAYCYNTEVADMRVDVLERAGRRAAWSKVDELRADGRAHFEYAQREPIEGVELKVA